MDSEESQLPKTLILKNAESKIECLLNSIPLAKNGQEQSAIRTKIFSILEVLERTVFNDFFQIISPIYKWIESKQEETLRFCESIVFYSLAGDQLIIKKKDDEESFKIIPAEELIKKIITKINPSFYFIQLAYLFKDENFLLAQLYFHGVKKA